MSPNPTSEAPPKRALVIGINKYPHLKERFQLKGCVNDALRIAGVLKDKFRFDHIRTLVDEQAGREAILEALDALVEETGPGDLVVIHYSGHGSTVKDRDGDEAGGRDSTIMPHDAYRPPGGNIDITDDEIHVRLVKLGQKTPNVTLIFDCCHSGTISRDGDETLARFHPGSSDPPVVEPSITDEDRALLADTTRSATGWLNPGGSYTLISGCRDTEKSYELPNPDANPDHVPHGSLTFHLTQALEQATPGTTYRDVFQAVSIKVNATNTSQNPQIEGALDREIFGTRDIEPMRFVPVTARSGRQVTIGSGAPAGLSVGSIWNIHAPTAKEATEENRLGTMRIDSVQATQSTGTLTEEVAEGTIGPLTRAVEVSRVHGSLGMAVRLEGDKALAPEAWTQVANAINNPTDGILAAAAPSGPAIRLLLVPARDSVGEGDTAPQAGPLAQPNFVLLSEAGDLMMAPKTADEVDDVLHNLRTWAQYRAKLAIDNPGNPLASRFTLELVRQGADGEWKPIPADDAGRPVVTVGDTFNVRLTRHGRDPLFVGLYYFEVTGGVSQQFPVGAEELKADRPHLLRPTGFQASWADRFPFYRDPRSTRPLEGVETLKAFLTTEPTDFSALQQVGVRDAGEDGEGAPLSPLQQLLRSSSGGTRAMDPVPADDWATVSLQFVLRERTAGTLTSDLAGVQAPLQGGTPQGPTVLDRVRLQSPNVSARIEGRGRLRPPSWGEDRGSRGLEDFLADADLHPVQTFSLADGEIAGSEFEAAATGTVELEREVPLEPGWGELAISMDQDGLVRWHFPEPAPPEVAGARSAGDAPTRYRIALETTGEPPTSDQRSRGVIGLLGQQLVKVMAFPLIDPLAQAAGGMAARFLEGWKRPNDLRAFTPEDYQATEGRGLQPTDWERLGGGRALMFLHGPVSRAHRAFRDFTPEEMAALHQFYGGRVFAFDHKTLTADPAQNVDWLLGQFPSDVNLELDIVAHSRGGLLARVLAERAAELSQNGRSLKVGRVVFAGSPNAGTALAKTENLQSMLDVITNLVGVVDPTEVMGPLAELGKLVAVGAWKSLDGLTAMSPGSAFLQKLEASRGDASPETRYHAIASDAAGGAGSSVLSRLKSSLAEQIFSGAANDLFVPAQSVFESGSQELMPPADRFVLSGSDSVGHFDYFQSRAAKEKVTEWLIREGAPITVDATTTTPAPVAEATSPAPSSVTPVADRAPVTSAPQPTPERVANEPSSPTLERPMSTERLRAPRFGSPRPETAPAEAAVATAAPARSRLRAPRFGSPSPETSPAVTAVATPAPARSRLRAPRFGSSENGVGERPGTVAARPVAQAPAAPATPRPVADTPVTASPSVDAATPSVTEMIRALNEDLAGELGAIAQYITYAARCTGPYRPQLSAFFLTEVADEQLHAIFLANKIVALRGVPTTKARAVPEAGSNREMLEAVLAAERRATADYTERARQAEAIGDKGLAVQLEDMVRDESGHADETERILRDWPL